MINHTSKIIRSVNDVITDDSDEFFVINVAPDKDVAAKNWLDINNIEYMYVALVDSPTTYYFPCNLEKDALYFKLRFA